MNKKIITDNGYEKLVCQWDGTRFALIQTQRHVIEPFTERIVVLSPIEMLALIGFAGNPNNKKGEG